MGIERVEVQIDDGDVAGRRRSRRRSTDDTWVQWFIDWDATPGTHYVTVRATDRNGDLQVEERAPIAPDGSTGWQRKRLQVG